MLDLLLTNGVVRTFDTTGRAEAVGIADGHIRYVGTTEDAPAARRTIDLRGRLLTPGIIDSHNHFSSDSIPTP
nr:hypothetical protein [Rhodococcus opacus]